MENLITDRFKNIGFLYNFSEQQFVYVHPSIRSVLNLAVDQLSLSDALTFVHEDDIEYITKAVGDILNGKEKPFLISRLKINRTERWFQFSLIQLQNEGRELIAGNAEEITSDLQNLRLVQRYANKKNSILQILAHDLRGPLGVAQMTAQIAGRQTSDVQLNKHLNLITGVIQQAIALITDLTNREFVETVEVALVKKRIDIAAKVKEYIDEMRRSEVTSMRVFTFQSNQDSIYIMLDEAKFMQIMNNLINNALKFTHDGGSIDVVMIDQEDSIRLLVKDDGIGIPEKSKPEIFKQQSQAGRIGLRGESTTGMGLFIVKTIIEWHRGTIWFESEEGKGTTFYVEIPKH